MKESISPGLACGRVRLFDVTLAFSSGPPKTQWDPRTPFMSNAILYEWGAILGNLLTRKGINYGIGGMYIEFENTETPETPIDDPAFDRGAASGVDYYDSLVDSPTRDYLRVPLIASSLVSTDLAKFPKGNAPRFFAQTSGVVGVHGKPFSDANNSIVFGAALVAFVDEYDSTRDLVLSRFYTDPDKQIAKLANNQIGLEWEIAFE